MDLATIAMPKEEAEEAFKAYRTAVKERHSDEDEQIMRGYKALAKGQQVVSLREAMERGGLDHRGLPRLAICRADAEWCHVRMPNGQGSVTFNMDEEWFNERATRRYVRLPSGVFPAFERGWSDADRPQRARAMVPTVPPALRPKAALSNYHVLWEAEWQTVPRDPALLRRIGGDLFAVLAVWNLTELERAVLAGRLFE